MKIGVLILLMNLFSFVPTEWKNWKTREFLMSYTSEDQSVYRKYGEWIKDGINRGEQFFGKKLTFIKRPVLCFLQACQ